MTKDLMVIDRNFIRLKKNIFGKRIICKVNERKRFYVKYSFRFSTVEKIIMAYYNFLLLGNEEMRFVGVRVKKNRDIHFLNKKYRKGILIGCMFFSDEIVHLIHSEIL